MNPSGESARINGADIHAAGQAACVPNGCGDCGGSASVTCPMLKERWTREDATHAARLNAETIVGMQMALRESESREAELRSVLGQLLEAIRDEEGNREAAVMVRANCPDCTHDVCLSFCKRQGFSVETCPRHRAHYLVHGVRP